MEAVELTSLIRVVAASAQMQQRGLQDTPPTPPRGRNNAKLKVLVRSHAMREETSPPREPTPTSVTHPCLSIIPSPSQSPTHISPSSGANPLLVLSPSLSRGNSPSPTSNSPTSTLVPSPTSRHSPNSPSGGKLRCLNADLDSDLGFCEPQTAALSPKNSSNKFYGQAEKLQTGLSVITSCSDELDEEEDSDDADNAQSSQSGPLTAGGASYKTAKQHVCAECSNVKCAKCSERNFNNNLSSNINNNNVAVSHSSNTLMVNQRTRGKLRHQSSSQGSFDSCSASPCLSRDSSSEQYTDTTGVDLGQFIPETLNRNAKDRALMLRIEQELVNLAKDTMRSHFKFPPMSSYQRMLVHRCAAYFGMDHNIESSGKCVVVNKTKNTRLPDLRFKEHILEEFNEEPRRSILKRDSNSCEDCNYKSPDRQTGMGGMENRRSKSFEEREEEYEKARRRIFNREMQMQNCDSQEELMWSDAPWSCTESENFSRLRLLPPGRLLKVHSVEGKGDTLRPCVAKSYSFGGYGGNVSVLSRGDSVTSTHSAGPRLMTKQDSGASSVSWRLSPSSSGYKSQSQRSESITPSPTSTPHTSIEISRQDSVSNEAAAPEGDKSEGQLVWAVTDIHNVPKGSVLINPQTGQPVTNQDGSIYHFDPSNPPPGFSSPATSTSAAAPAAATSSSVQTSTTANACSSSSSSSSHFKPPASPQNHKTPSPHKTAAVASTASNAISGNVTTQHQQQHQQQHHPQQQQQQHHQQQLPKERPPSPKRRPPRISPTKKAASVTTTATSPSLPFSPPALGALPPPSLALGPPPLPSHQQQQQQQLSLQQGGGGRAMSMGYAVQAAAAAAPATNLMDNSSGGSSSMSMPQYATAVYPAANYSTSMDSSVPMYQSPMGVVYTGYSMAAPHSHPQYENRVDSQMTDMSGYFMNMNISTDPASIQHQAAPQSMSYQGSAPCWNQQAPMVFYQSAPAAANQPPQPPRYSIPVPNPPGPYISAPYAQNYSAQNVPQQPAAPNAAELIQIYQNPVQMVYGAPTVNPNQMMYPNHQGSVIYAQNPMYSSAPMYPTQTSGAIPSGCYAPPPPPLQQQHPPPCTSTPNSTASTPHYAGTGVGCYAEQPTTPLLQPYCNQPPPPQPPLEIVARSHRNYAPKGNKFSSPKAAFMQQQQQQTMGSSGQSSGGTNSPAAGGAATLVTGYYTNPMMGAGPPAAGNNMLYRQTPPETPPNPPPNMGFGYSVVQPMVFRQLTTVRASPPVTQSSRSPTPADTAPNDRQRYSLPPNLYHGIMPYVVQNDPRMSSGRGQPSAYRQPPVRQQSINSQSSNDSRTYKSRKSRGNKTQSLPPSGKQLQQQQQQHQPNQSANNAQKI